jgi:hypothetical protein
VKGKVEIQRNGGPWEPAVDGHELQQGDRIHSGWKGSVTATFPDGSNLAVEPMALVAFEQVVYNGAESRSRILLRLGEVRAQVQKMAGAAGDFRVRTPTTTASVRGTAFSVFYDGSSTIVSVTLDSVTVTPTSGTPVVVQAGTEAASTATTVSLPVPIGQAGAPKGSVGPAKAIMLFTGATARQFARCKAQPYSVSLKPVNKGWQATAKLIGSLKGNGVWTIRGKKVAPTNALARRIATGCH